MTAFAALAEHIGGWAGTNGFRLMPSDPTHDAPATADVETRAAGNLVVVGYTWSHPEDGAQDGLVVVGAADEPGTVTALWGDSWHQRPEPVVCTGTVDGGVVAFGYEYGPGWWWHVVVDGGGSGALRIRMDNSVPEDPVEGRPAETYAAMAMELRRSDL